MTEYTYIHSTVHCHLLYIATMDLYYMNTLIWPDICSARFGSGGRVSHVVCSMLQLLFSVQGSHTALKVLEFFYPKFKVLKVLENRTGA